MASAAGIRKRHIAAEDSGSDDEEQTPQRTTRRRENVDDEPSPDNTPPSRQQGETDAAFLARCANVAAKAACDTASHTKAISSRLASLPTDLANALAPLIKGDSAPDSIIVQDKDLAKLKPYVMLAYDQYGSYGPTDALNDNIFGNLARFLVGGADGSDMADPNLILARKIKDGLSSRNAKWRNEYHGRLRPALQALLGEDVLPMYSLADPTPTSKRLTGLKVLKRGVFEPESVCSKFLKDHAYASSTRAGKDPYQRGAFRACLLMAYDGQGTDCDYEDCLGRLSVGQIATFMSLVHHALTTRTLTLATQGMQDTVGVQQAQLMRSISQWRSPYREQGDILDPSDPAWVQKRKDIAV